MKILAMDSSDRSFSLALASEAGLIGETTYQIGYKHSETLLPALATLLQQCEVSLEAVDLFAVSRGPGSFTGIRIGISTVKALAYALQKPVVGVSSLQVLAWPLLQAGQKVLAVVDSRGGRMFSAVYQLAAHQPESVVGSPQGDWPEVLTLLPEENRQVTDLLHDLEQMNLLADGLWVTGNGVPVFSETVAKSKRMSPAAFHYSPPEAWPIRASAVALLAQAQWSTGLDKGDPFQLSPNYCALTQPDRLAAELQSDRPTTKRPQPD